MRHAVLTAIVPVVRKQLIAYALVLVRMVHAATLLRALFLFPAAETRALSLNLFPQLGTSALLLFLMDLGYIMALSRFPL